MDEIITKVWSGIRRGGGISKSYTVPFTKSENDLQNMTAKMRAKNNILILVQKTKCMTTSKDPRRCKLEVTEQIIYAVSQGDMQNEMRQTVM